MGVIGVRYQSVMGQKAGQAVDQDEEEDGTNNGTLRDSVGERERRRGASGEVAAESARRHTIPLMLVQDQ